MPNASRAPHVDMPLQAVTMCRCPYCGCLSQDVASAQTSQGDGSLGQCVSCLRLFVLPYATVVLANLLQWVHFQHVHYLQLHGLHMQMQMHAQYVHAAGPAAHAPPPAPVQGRRRGWGHARAPAQAPAPAPAPAPPPPLPRSPAQAQVAPLADAEPGAAPPTCSRNSPEPEARARAQEAEARAQEAEARAQEAEARAQEAEARMQGVQAEAAATVKEAEAQVGAVKAECAAACEAAAAGDAEVSAIRKAHAAEVVAVRKAHAAEVAAIRKAHGADVAAVLHRARASAQAAHTATEATLHRVHAAKVGAVEDAHAAEVDALRNAHAAHVAQLQSVYAADLHGSVRLARRSPTGAKAPERCDAARIDGWPREGGRVRAQRHDDEDDDGGDDALLDALALEASCSSVLGECDGISHVLRSIGAEVDVSRVGVEATTVDAAGTGGTPGASIARAMGSAQRASDALGGDGTGAGSGGGDARGKGRAAGDRRPRGGFPRATDVCRTFVRALGERMDTLTQLAVEAREYVTRLWRSYDAVARELVCVAQLVRPDLTVDAAGAVAADHVAAAVRNSLVNLRMHLHVYEQVIGDLEGTTVLTSACRIDAPKGAGATGAGVGIRDDTPGRALLGQCDLRHCAGPVGTADPPRPGSGRAGVGAGTGVDRLEDLCPQRGNVFRSRLFENSRRMWLFAAEHGLMARSLSRGGSFACPYVLDKAAQILHVTLDTYRRLVDLAVAAASKAEQCHAQQPQPHQGLVQHAGQSASCDGAVHSAWAVWATSVAGGNAWLRTHMQAILHMDLPGALATGVELRGRGRASFGTAGTGAGAGAGASSAGASSVGASEGAGASAGAGAVASSAGASAGASAGDSSAGASSEGASAAGASMWTRLAAAVSVVEDWPTREHWRRALEDLGGSPLRVLASVARALCAARGSAHCATLPLLRDAFCLTCAADVRVGAALQTLSATRATSAGASAGPSALPPLATTVWDERDVRCAEAVSCIQTRWVPAPEPAPVAAGDSARAPLAPTSTPLANMLRLAETVRSDFLALMSACAPTISLAFTELAQRGEIRAVRTELFGTTRVLSPPPTLGADVDVAGPAPPGSCADSGCSARDDATNGARKVSRRRAKKGARSSAAPPGSGV